MLDLLRPWQNGLLFNEFNVCVFQLRLQEFILDESKPMADRLWVWLHYGTAYRAMYTLPLGPVEHRSESCSQPLLREPSTLPLITAHSLNHTGGPYLV